MDAPSPGVLAPAELAPGLFPTSCRTTLSLARVVHY